MRKRTPVIDRLLAKILIHEDGCWIWASPSVSNGYGKISVPGGMAWAHRVSYEEFVGPIPEGMHLHHLCEHRLCVNYSHLVLVDPARHHAEHHADWPGVTNKRKTHCKRGHEFTPENTYVRSNGYRLCRRCAVLYSHGLRSTTPRNAIEVTRTP